jgi:hypothetical protein
MLSIQTLFDIAKCRIEDAKVLASNKRPDGAVYLCGYALEMVLKRRIAMILDWGGYPETRAEFDDYKSFKIHDLDILLRLSGFERKLQANTVMYAKWQIASNWDSEIRYKQIGNVSDADAKDIINATRDIANFILKSTQ